jgi:hypothetical protein
MSEAEAKQWIADTEQHVRDGLITKREGRRKIAEIKKRVKAE